MQNPFDSDLARANCCCPAWLPGDDAPGWLKTKPLSAAAESAHRQFREMMLDRDYACIGASAAVHKDTYRFGVYDSLDAPASTAGLAYDLFEFVQVQDRLGGDYTTFIAHFLSPSTRDEREFEDLMWGQLRALHALDSRHHPWSAEVSPDPEDPRFGYSFAGRAFFVVGMHPASSRIMRRSEVPTLVFNAHHLFRALREKGWYERFQTIIRARDIKAQGSQNPSLSNFGENSEARQYSGRLAEEGWKCPFHAAAPTGRDEEGK
jgi:FPC/CPF motif-containing protein YcgG